MSEISPTVRPMMVHELYPAPSTSELRAKYATDENNSYDAAKAREAYQASESSAQQMNQGQRVETSGNVVAYEMKNGNMHTSTTFSAPGPTISWLV